MSICPVSGAPRPASGRGFLPLEGAQETPPPRTGRVRRGRRLRPAHGERAARAPARLRNNGSPGGAELGAGGVRGAGSPLPPRPRLRHAPRTGRAGVFVTRRRQPRGHKGKASLRARSCVRPRPAPPARAPAPCSPRGALPALARPRPSPAPGSPNEAVPSAEGRGLAGMLRGCPGRLHGC